MTTTLINFRLTGSITATNSPFFGLTWRWYGSGKFTISSFYADINLTLGITVFGLVNPDISDYQFTNVTMKGYWKIKTDSLSSGLVYYHVFEN